MSTWGWLILVVGVAFLCWSISRKEKNPTSVFSPSEPISPPGASIAGPKFVGDKLASSQDAGSLERIVGDRAQPSAIPSATVRDNAMKGLGADLGLLSPAIRLAEQQSDGDDFLPTIPSGFQIYAWRVSVAGIHLRKEDALNFIRSSGKSLVFERDVANAKDANAIKIIGVAGPTQHFLGYVPAEVAEQIVGSGLFDVVRARLERAYASGTGYVDVMFQVIGPKSLKQVYLDFPGTKPASTEQKEFYKFFGLAVPRGLVIRQAAAAIDAHTNTLRAGNDVKLLEWEAFEALWDEVDEVEFGYAYGIKKISRSAFKEALAALTANGVTLVAVRDDIQMLVDKILELKPAMARADA